MFLVWQPHQNCALFRGRGRPVRGWFGTNRMTMLRLGDDAARVVNEPYKHSHAPQAPPVMVKEIRLIADFLSMFFESSLSLRIVHYICGSPLYTLF